MSHLPLIFADGQPTCLDKITQTQLERFIPFMLQCCPRSKVSPPKWWPKELPFSFPLKPTPALQKEWMPLLKKIVKECYNHYDSSYILEFCRKLTSLGCKRLFFKENADRVDIYERISNKLLVSVKSKNKTYDLPSASPHKSLLPRPLPGQEAFKSQPVIDDIYLCTYCDAEFTCCKDACEHEKTVHAPAIEEKCTPQERYLKLLGLLPLAVHKSTVDENVAKPRRIASNLSIRKCHSIPICTPLGGLLLANTLTLRTQDIAKAQSKVEQFCCTDDIVISAKNAVRRSRRVLGVNVTRFQSVWSHEHCFNRRQRAERMETIRTGLDANARRLLQRCRPAKVSVRRLPPLPRHSTINLRRLKEFVAEEFPNQTILEPRKPPTPIWPEHVAKQFHLGQLDTISKYSMTRLHAAFKARSPLAGVQTNQMNTKCNPVSGIITKMVTFQPIRNSPTPAMTRLPSRSKEPIVIDLCSSSDEECEVIPIPAEEMVAIPDKTVKDKFPLLVNAPKYGVTAASPKLNGPKLTQTELAGLPAKDNHPSNTSFSYVQQFCRTRS